MSELGVHSCYLQRWYIIGQLTLRVQQLELRVSPVHVHGMEIAEESHVSHNCVISQHYS